jgi:ferritin-like metal-binding protein YciE
MITSNTSDTATDERHTVAEYVSDILALEQHINAPVKSQLASTEQYGTATTIVNEIATVSQRHIDALEARLDALGKPATHGVKSVWAQLVGGGAAALNQVRSTKVSKSLRDDYTALGLAAISYTMLHATASALGDTLTASLAKRHLDDITPIIVNISSEIPAIVLEELSADGEQVQITAAELTQSATKDAWSGDKVH